MTRCHYERILNSVSFSYGNILICFFCECKGLNSINFRFEVKLEMFSCTSSPFYYNFTNVYDISFVLCLCFKELKWFPN